jgi:hypothetical protein
MVLLTSERALLRSGIRRQEALVLQSEMPVVVRGVPSAIFTVLRVAG